jgi:hypothetical protein
MKRTVITVMTLLGTVTLVNAQVTTARLFLADSAQTPVNTIYSFVNPTDVGNRYGVNSYRYRLAQSFYQGTSSPPYYTMYFTRMPNLSARAHLFGADIRKTGQIAKIRKVTNGAVTITVNGFTYVSAPLNFSSDSVYGEIGITLQNGLNANLAQEAAINASITPQTTTFSATVKGSVLKVTNVSSGTVEIGSYVCKTSNPCYGPYLSNPQSPDYVGEISGFLAWEPGTNGGVGYYSLFIPSSTIALTGMVATYGLLTINSTSSGSVNQGMAVAASGVVLPYTAILEGVPGNPNQWIVDQSQTASSSDMALTEPPLSVVWTPYTGVTVNSRLFTGPDLAQLQLGRRNYRLLD